MWLLQLPLYKILLLQLELDLHLSLLLLGAPLHGLHQLLHLLPQSLHLDMRRDGGLAGLTLWLGKNANRSGMTRRRLRRLLRPKRLRRRSNKPLLKLPRQ